MFDKCSVNFSQKFAYGFTRVNNRFQHMITRRSFLIIGGHCMTIPQVARAQSPTSVPPEDHPHEATFMQWPVDPAVYPDRYHLKQVQKPLRRLRIQPARLNL